VNRVFYRAGLAACIAVALVMSGGDWFMLQSVAWGRMLVDFSQRDTWRNAVVKTFDGQHPCALCLKIRLGWQTEKQQEERTPSEKLERMPDLVCQFSRVTVPAAPTAARELQPFIPQFCSEFIDSPPTPPPRAGAQML
jgi:hypothetical protein